MYQNGQEFFDSLLEVLDYAHQYSGYIVSRCPFHDDTRPSFFVYPDKYRCSSCGAYGDTSKLLGKINRGGSIIAPVTNREDFRNPWTGWLKRTSLERALTIAWKNGQSNYLQGRGIDNETQKKLGIGKMDGWITFPIKDSAGHIIGAVARAGEENPSMAKYVTPAGQSPNILFVPSWKRINNADKVIVTFGILDAVTLFMLGFASISTTSGKRVHPSAFDAIRKPIKIIPDQKEESDALRLSAKLGWRGKTVQMKYPDKAKDINDLMWKCGMESDAVKEMISYELV